jgi:4'-phosphopantetheinyl transferase
MLLRKEHIDDGGLIGIGTISGDYRELLRLLPAGQLQAAKEVISKMRSERRVMEWLTTRVLLFELLGEEKIIDNQPDGRPFLVDGSYKISISHTREYAALLLHRECLVGIDVETISERVKRLSEKFISEHEYIDPSQQVIHQLLHWSAKETMFKVMEEREIDFKIHLRVHPFQPGMKGHFQASESKTLQRKTYQIHYEILPGAVLTWVVDR